MEERPNYYVHLEMAIMDLLGRVVQRPRTTLLDPPVPFELIANDLEKFKTHSALHIDQAARSCVYRISNTISEGITSKGFDNGKPLNGSSEITMAYAYDFLDILLIFSENNVASETLVHNMMEEFVDCTVIEIAKLIFEYMQSRSARLVEGFNPAKGKGPILLRTTNELKRRLSRETDAAFIGRIMIFISLLLPPWERSGVNLRGNYNVESITKYEEPEQDENKMAIDIDDDSTDSFYVKFWSLQKYLKNPIVLHDQNVLDEFKPKLDFVINKFFSIEQERLKLRGQAVSNKTTPDQKMDIVIGSEDKSEYYPGFLKSRQLFDLQMADSKFRRTVLFQTMVVMRHLLSLTAAEKEKRDSRTRTPNRVVLYAFTLSPEDASWAQKKDKDAYNLTDLAFQPHPQHRTFSKAVRAVLDRDEAWVRWKENGCPPFEEPSWTEKEFDAVEKRLRQITAPLAPYRFPLGNDELSKLWRNAGDLSMQSLVGRVQLPNPEKFVTDELDKAELDSLPPAEQVQLIDQRASREWRGLRLAMKYDMVGVAEQKGSLTKYVDSKQDSVKEVKDEQMADVEAPRKHNGKLEVAEDKRGEAMDVQNGS